MTATPGSGRILVRGAAVAGGVLLIALVAVGADAARRSPKGNDPAAFELSGSTTGLYPTVAGSLPLKIENPSSFDVVVDDITITVGDASAACPGTSLEVGAVPPVRVSAAGEVVVPVPVTMASTAPDACQGATFPLTYGATASKAK